MSTFLELCKTTVEKCGISGAFTSVVGQRGEFLRVVNWVNEAWHEIQLAQSNWQWMRDDFSFTTTAAQQAYTPAQAGITERFRSWHTDTFRAYKVASGPSDDHPINEIGWQNFRETYLFGVQPTGSPSVFTVRPKDRSLLLGLIPDAEYQVYGEYQKTPYYLVNNTDVPDMPEEYHQIIVHGARIRYASFDNAPEVLLEAQRDQGRMMAIMVQSQLEDIGMGQPLA